MVYLSRNKKALLLALSIHFMLIGGILASWYDLSKNQEDQSEKMMVIRLYNVPRTDIEKSSLPSIAHPFNHIDNERIKSKVYRAEDQDLMDQLPKTDVQMQEETSVVIPSGRVEILIKRHYGELFEELSKEEKKYILENIVKIHRIDRKIGNALLADKPRNAFRDGESNYVEMYLHPDGTISDITIINDGDHPELDKLTMETVERSYSSYPLPNQVTLIRLHTKIYKAK